ncbi:hypothetical protein PJP07_30475, partial [Mycobacterium kansasii]
MGHTKLNLKPTISYRFFDVIAMDGVDCIKNITVEPTKHISAAPALILRTSVKNGHGGPFYDQYHGRIHDPDRPVVSNRP